MIVTYTESGWEIVTQRGHGLLAAEFCARWKLSDQPKRWVETLIACAGHDDAFNEFESQPLLTASGGPKNFNMCAFDAKASQLLMDMALTKNHFIALLTARHIAFTHGSEPKAKSFLSTLRKREKVWMKVAETTPNELDRAYELLELCDALSLLICQNILQPEKRSLEISNGPSGTTYYVVMEGDRLKVQPWPFEVEEFRVSYEVRKIAKLTFKTDLEFRKTLRSTYPKRITLTLTTQL